MGEKGGGAAVMLSPTAGTTSNTLWPTGLCRGLLPYQVACSSIQPFGHDRHGPKIGWGGCALFLEVAESPSNTKSPEPRPISIPTGILDLSSRLATTDNGRTLGTVPL